MVYKNKLSQIKMLKKQQGYKGLIPAKKEIGTRFTLTNLHIDLMDTDIMCYILEHFKSVINVYVRKCGLKNDRVASFVFIVYTEDEVDPKTFVNHNWPGRIRCFFAPDRKRSNY